MEVSGQVHTTAALPQGKNLWYPLFRRLSGPQSRVGRGGEEKILCVNYVSIALNSEIQRWKSWTDLACVCK